MHITNTPEVLKMLKDKRVLKMMLDIHNKYKVDPEYSIKKAIKASRVMSDGEKIIEFNGMYILTSFLPPIPSRAFMTNIDAIRDICTPYQDRMYSKRTAPVSMYLALTNQCPHRCVYCSQKGQETDALLSKEEWISVIKKLQNMNTSIIGFTGGEPLLRKDLEDIISAVDERSITYLFTSGTGLTLARAKRLKKSGLFGVSISLDSHDEDLHNINRGGEHAFRDSIRAIRHAVEAGLYTMIQMVASKKELNKKSLFKFFQFAASLNVHEVKILEPIRSGKLLKNNEEKIYFTQKDREKLIEIQKSANKKRNFPKITVFSNTESREKYGCGAGTQHSYIDCSGNLYPCDFVPMSFGNVLEQSIDRLWLEMTEAMGKPKCECYGQKINRSVYSLAEGKLPLNPKLSYRLAKDTQSEEYPKVYKILQGDDS